MFVASSTKYVDLVWTPLLRNEKKIQIILNKIYITYKSYIATLLKKAFDVKEIIYSIDIDKNIIVIFYRRWAVTL